MKQIKWNLLAFAILAAACIAGIGMAIAEKSILGAIGCIIAVILVMGFGFKTKKRMRENGQL
jgi:FtsH-binding integral membrane protein